MSQFKNWGPRIRLAFGSLHCFTNFFHYAEIIGCMTERTVRQSSSNKTAFHEPNHLFGPNIFDLKTNISVSFHNGNDQSSSVILNDKVNLPYFSLRKSIQPPHFWKMDPTTILINRTRFICS